MKCLGALAELLACPGCGAAVQPKTSFLSCAGCSEVFPTLADLPCLYPEPTLELARWSARLRVHLEQSERASALIARDLTRGPRELTRKRLILQLTAEEAQREQLKRLLSQLLKSPRGTVPEALLDGEKGAGAFAGQALFGYFTNVFRDWCWGDEENARSLRCVLECLGESRQLGRTAVLGAGAGRLALDLHQATQPDLTVALDLNPLLAALGSRVISGEIIELHEFPLAPRDLESFAVARRCQSPGPKPENFHFVLADVLRAPFRRGAFNTVVTPWLVDILPDDAALFAKRMNRLLASSGRWIYFGSVAFAKDAPGRRYSPEELQELAREAGFEIRRARTDEIPYLCSPANCMRRTERVVTWIAEKISETEVPAEDAIGKLPSHLLNPGEPVPSLPQYQRVIQINSIMLEVLRQIDGKRSVADISAALAVKYSMDPQATVSLVRGFLTRIFDGTQS